MEFKFRTLREFHDHFRDEETCVAYYEHKRWGGNVACPHCGSLKVYRTNRGFKCGEKLCRRKFSVTSGTIFENTKIGLRTWFAALYLLSSCKKGISSVQLAEQMGITQKTGWFLLQRLREMLADRDTSQLEGTVMADESWVGGKNRNRHADKKIDKADNASGKTPVVGMVQQGGKVRTFVAREVTAETLHGLVGSNVKEGSILVTDSHKGYVGLGDRYTHVSVKHEGGGYTVTMGNVRFTTNNIECYWSLFKRGIIGIYHFVSTKHLQRYCNEFQYRFNNRDGSGPSRFNSSLLHASSARITYKQLVHEEDEPIIQKEIDTTDLSMVPIVGSAAINGRIEDIDFTEIK